MFIFFTCIKKTNQKKVQPITWSGCVGLPGVYALFLSVLLAKIGRHRKVAPIGCSAESPIRSLRSLCPVFRGAARRREAA